ncbi:MAG TPA: cytochrome c [Burkholderiaceae bacterium]|nr:cytochrome c [Burkholderiaceae bacterium]
MCNDEPRRRRIALAVLGLMTVLFAALSILSFVGPRKQALPQEVSFDRYSAVEGRRVFQAYNCMGCHTIVGNGAYFGPDLTDLYRRAGPAWLAAFLPSAGAWPTAAAIRVQLQNPAVAAAAGTDSFDDYLERYPAARERIERRGGTNTFMPNLPFTRDEIGQLIAFLRYTSAMNTEGWPPTPWPAARAAAAAGAIGAPTVAATAATASAAASASASAAAPAPAGAAAGASAADPAAQGAKLVQDLGCLACHATDTQRKVGPGWGGLYGSQSKLADGSTVTADDAYLEQSIVQPDARIAAGFAAGVMPSYETLTTHEQREAIVAYIRSLARK